VPIESLVSVLSGVVLVILGLAFLRRHRRTWRARQVDPALEDHQRRYYVRQYRRRLVTSGLIVLIGILIPIGDMLLERRPAPPAVPLTLFWIGVLLIVLLVLLLGLLDLFATGLHARDEISRFYSEKAALERQAEELRKALRDAES
jgi:hypothetical protein